VTKENHFSVPAVGARRVISYAEAASQNVTPKALSKGQGSVNNPVVQGSASETYQPTSQQYWTGTAWVQQEGSSGFYLFIGASNESTPLPCYYMRLWSDVDWRYFGTGNWQHLAYGDIDGYWYKKLQISDTFSNSGPWQARNHAWHYFFDYRFGPAEWILDHTVYGTAYAREARPLP